jgi:hypothetical protein
MSTKCVAVDGIVTPRQSLICWAPIETAIPDVNPYLTVSGTHPGKSHGYNHESAHQAGSEQTGDSILHNDGLKNDHKSCCWARYLESGTSQQSCNETRNDHCVES